MAEIDVCSHGRPDHQELVRQLREACGLSGPPLPISPKEAFEEALEWCRRMHRREVDPFGVRALIDGQACESETP